LVICTGGIILLKKFREERIKEIEGLRALGINPYPYSYKKTHTSEDIRKQFQNIANGEVTDERVSTAGRVMALREHGKSTFFHIKDTFGRIQAYVRKIERRIMNFQRAYHCRRHNRYRRNRLQEQHR